MIWMEQHGQSIWAAAAAAAGTWVLVSWLHPKKEGNGEYIPQLVLDRSPKENEQ
jgi:hypothetical protein